MASNIVVLGLVSNKLITFGFAAGAGITPPPLTPAQLAQLYGGGFMHEKGKKKKKPIVEELAVMVKTIAEDDPGGKQKLIALLPTKDRLEPTDEAWEATTMSLIMQIRESTQKVQKGVEKLYYEHRQRDDDEAFVLFNL